MFLRYGISRYGEFLEIVREFLFFDKKQVNNAWYLQMNNVLMCVVATLYDGWSREVFRIDQLFCMLNK